MLYTIQTIYFLKAGDTHYPATHCPLTHHPHRPTIPTKPTHKPPYMAISPLYDVIHYTNHIFSESWWYPLFTEPLPTHPSPTQTHHTHITHPQPTYYDNISTLSCSTVYKSYIFSKLVIPTIPWLWTTVMTLIFYNTVVQQGRVFPVSGFFLLKSNSFLRI